MRECIFSDGDKCETDGEKCQRKGCFISEEEIIAEIKDSMDGREDTVQVMPRV